MKAILRLEMPEDCRDCPCYDRINNICNVTDSLLSYFFMDERPKWCPLESAAEEE